MGATTTTFLIIYNAFASTSTAVFLICGLVLSIQVAYIIFKFGYKKIQEAAFDNMVHRTAQGRAKLQKSLHDKGIF